MNKVIAISAVILTSMNSSAGKVKECNDFWSPLISDAKEDCKALDKEWKEEHDSEVLTALFKMKDLVELRKKARTYCLSYGLEQSKQKYEDAL